MSSPVSATEGAAEAAPLKAKHSPLLSLLAILLALVGGFLIGYSFLTGITAQFDPSGGHSSLYIALFFIGLGIVIVGIVFALVGIVRRAHRNISLIALVLTMLPSFVVLVIAALTFL
ncbi:MAG: hypothetical protein ABIS08_03475 [Pseudolysinimonas sp.]